MKDLSLQLPFSRFRQDPIKLLSKLDKVLAYYDLQTVASVDDLRLAIYQGVKPQALAQKYFSQAALALPVEAQNLYRLIIDLYNNLPQQQFKGRSYLELQAQAGIKKIVTGEGLKLDRRFSRNLSIAEELEKDTRQKLFRLKHLVGGLDADLDKILPGETIYFDELKLDLPSSALPEIENQLVAQKDWLEQLPLYRLATRFAAQVNELLKPFFHQRGAPQALKQLAFETFTVAGKVVGAYLAPGELLATEQANEVRLEFLENGFAALQNCLAALHQVKRNKLIIAKALDQVLELGGDLYFEYLKEIEQLKCLLGGRK